MVTHGSDELRNRALRPMFTGEDVWCQLFSEPGSGSDLAGLATRAVKDGDEWVVNGQKVWNTLAHLADKGMLVARTDPELPKHKGLTYFMVDMHAPGVEVRPLRQITGEAEFNEVYLTDVRIPDADRIGDIGDGWRVSMTTLMNERTTIGAGAAAVRSAARGSIAEAIYTWKHTDNHTPARATRSMKLWCDAEVLRLTNMRAAQQAACRQPRARGLDREARVRQPQQVGLRVVHRHARARPGSSATTTRSGARREAALDGAPGTARKFFLRSRANSIEGGTSEIMRNILGERILGLPGEPRVDRDLPVVAGPAKLSRRQRFAARIRCTDRTTRARGSSPDLTAASRPATAAS